MGKLNPAGKFSPIKSAILIAIFAVLVVTLMIASKFPQFENKILLSDAPHADENILANTSPNNNLTIFSNNSAHEPNQEIFSIRQNYFVFFPVYPQPLVYVYKESPLLYDGSNEEFVAPVGIAFNIEVTNLKPNPIRIRAYAANLQMEDGSWSRIYSLPTDLKHKLYLDESGSFERCRELEFEPNLFDRQAKSKTLMSGESVGGWIFFEWSPELRTNRKIRKLKLEIESTQNETSYVVFDFLSDETSLSTRKSLVDEKGASDFFSGEVKIKNENGFEDLSRLPIRPYRNE